MDLTLLLISGVLGGVLLVDYLENDDIHPGWLVIWVVLTGWLLAMVLTGKSISYTEAYPIQTFEQNGQTYQMYINKDGTITNVTQQFGRLFPEGSMLKKSYTKAWHLGCYCLMGRLGPIEVWSPTPDGEMVKIPTGDRFLTR